MAFADEVIAPELIRGIASRIVKGAKPADLPGAAARIEYRYRWAEGQSRRSSSGRRRARGAARWRRLCPGRTQPFRPGTSCSLSH
jgi:hypothetical protein